MLESPRMNVLVGKSGLVVDEQLRGAVPNRELKRLVPTIQGDRLQMHNRRVYEGKEEGDTQKNNTLAFDTERHSQERPYRLSYPKGPQYIGGNAMNVGLNYMSTMKAFDATGELAAEMHFHAQVTSATVHELLGKDIDMAQFHVYPGAESETREGHFLPRSGGKEALHLGHTPNFKKEDYALPGSREHGEDFFISSTWKNTNIWRQLTDRVKQNPDNRLILMPGRNKLPNDVEDEVMKSTDLVTFNVREAEAFLRRRNPELLAHIEGAGTNRSGLLAMAVCIMGPKRALITNGGSVVSLYDRDTGETITVKPPAIEASQQIVREKLGGVMTTVPIFTGCGDAVIGVFIALEKLTRQNVLQLSPKEQLQLAVTISSCHAWNPSSNIVYMQPKELRAIADTAVTRMAA